MTPTRASALGLGAALGALLASLLFWGAGAGPGVESTDEAAAPVLERVDSLAPVQRPELERAPIPSGLATVTGRVIDDHGAVQARVNLWGGAERRSTFSDTAGAFELGELPPGEYELTAWRSGFYLHSRTLSLAPGERAEIELVMKRQESISIAIRIRGTAEGPRGSVLGNLETRVCADPSEEGDSRAPERMKRVDVDLTETDRGDREGRISFRSERPERVWVHLVFGDQVVDSRRVDRATRSIVFDVEGEALVRMLGSIRLRWVDPSDPPLAVFGRVRGSLYSSFGFDPEGRMTVDGLRPGDYVVQVRSQETLFYERDVHLTAGEHRDLGDAHPLLIEGVVAGPNGDPARNVPVRIGRFLAEHAVVAWTEDRWMRTGRDGTFRFDRLRPGPYVVRCDRVADPALLTEFPDMGTGGTWIEVKDRPVRDVTLALQPTRHVTVPARGAKARTRSLRIHHADGYELRSEWVLETPYDLYLVPGSYKVAWWSEREELARESFVVLDAPVTLRTPP